MRTASRWDSPARTWWTRGRPEAPEAAIQRLREAGARDIRFLCLPATPERLKRLRTAYPDVPVVTAAVDERLSDEGWIIQGLADAGDRIHGTEAP